RTTRFSQCRQHARLFPVERGARHEPVMEEDRDALAFPHSVTDLDSVGALKDSHDFVGVLPPHPHGCWKALTDVVGAIRPRGSSGEVVIALMTLWGYFPRTPTAAGRR